MGDKLRGGTTIGGNIVWHAGNQDNMYQGNNSILLGPNSSWGKYLRIGGNGNADTVNASVVTTDGNLHIDAAAGTHTTYVNFYKGTGGTNFGNGAGATVASVNASGSLTCTGITNSGTYSGKIDVANHTTNDTEYDLVWENTAGILYTSTGDLRYNPANKRITCGQVKIGDGAILKESADRADVLTIEGQTSTWCGIQIDNTSTETLWSFMADGTTCGIYDDTSGAWHLQMSDGGGTRLYQASAQKLTTTTTGVAVTGEVTATTNVTAYFSDERLKDKIGHIENPIDKLKAIDTFFYTSNELAASFGYTSKESQVGVSAQSVQAVLPECVKPAPFDIDIDDITGEKRSRSGEDYLTVQYEKLVPLLIEAIKEQQLQIEALTARVEELEK